MYQAQGLQNMLFILLYSAVMALAAAAAAYLLLRRQNAVSRQVQSPFVLRRWTAAFLAAMALSHVWWLLLGNLWLTDDRQVRNAVAIGLDSVTLVPTMMMVLLHMLQDRRRPLWPVVLLQVPVVAAVAVAVARLGNDFELFVRYYLLALAVAFIIYMVFQVRRYGFWLRDNFADLEQKEVWQSLVTLAVILSMFGTYKSNFGGMAVEYLVQVNSLVLIGFLLWRVETLQQLDPLVPAEPLPTAPVDAAAPAVAAVDDVVSLADGDAAATADKKPALTGIAAQLHYRCEVPRLYLQHDLTLSQLADAVGASREALRSWFTAHDDSYHAYINRLRIDHFLRLIRLAQSAGQTFTVFQLATQCGYRSYSSFSSAFKEHTGQSIAHWNPSFLSATFTQQ